MELRAMLQQAAALMQAGRMDDSAKLCREVLSSAPGQPDALHFLALAAGKRGESAAAEKLFRESLAGAPTPDVLVNYGIFLRGLGRAAEAEAQLRKAIKLAPKFAPGWHNLGLLLHAAGELQEASRCAKKLTRLVPTNPSGWELLAAIRQKQGNNSAAMASCEQGLMHAPAASRLHYSLAQLLREESHFGEAAVAYEAAFRCGYETPDLYRNLAEALFEAGEVERAMDSADGAVARFPENALLQRTRARLHWETGAAGDPVAALAQAARNNPRNPELWSTMASLLNRLGREDESRAVLAEARVSGCPRTPDLLLLDALGDAHAGMSGDATAKFTQLVAAYPQHTDIKLSFADHLLSTGDPARAESFCAGILEQEPHNQLALAHRGTAWHMLGDARASWLLDYERMVRPVRVPPPSGYSSTEAFFIDVQAALESLHRTQAHPIEQSLRGGTQTNGYLFRLKHPLLRVLETQIRLAVGSALAEFTEDASHPFWGRRRGSPEPGSFSFAGAWSVRLKSEGYHTNHIHPQGWISSALYIALPREMGEEQGQAGHIQFGVPLGLALPPRRIVRPEVGTLVLFPSYMWHGTVPFTSQQPRITVAFDLVPHN